MSRPFGRGGTAFGIGGFEPPQPPLPNGSISHRGWPVLFWAQGQARPSWRSRRRSRSRTLYQPALSTPARLVLGGLARPHREFRDGQEPDEAAQLAACRPAPNSGGGAQESLSMLLGILRWRSGELLVRPVAAEGQGRVGRRQWPQLVRRVCALCRRVRAPWRHEGRRLRGAEG